jgi:hypothetical protein
MNSIVEPTLIKYKRQKEADANASASKLTFIPREKILT